MSHCSEFFLSLVSSNLMLLSLSSARHAGGLLIPIGFFVITVSLWEIDSI